MAVGCTRGQGGLGRWSGLEAVDWVAARARGVLAEPINLRRTEEGELGACTDGGRDELDLGRIAPALIRGRRREEKGEVVRSAPRRS